MGICNLRYLDSEIEKRRKVVELYRSLLQDAEGIKLNQVQENLKCNYAYFPVLFHEAARRDEVYLKLREHGIYARKYFYPLTADAACFKNKYRSAKLEKARDFTQRILTLPLYADLEADNVKRIVKLIQE